MFILCAIRLSAHDYISTKLTWTQEISRIVYRHCTNCHQDGGPAMSLMTYQDARPWAKAIRDEVATRNMPPWGPVKGVGDFLSDPSLSQIEIDLIVNWVEGGAPEGAPAYLPRARQFPPPPDPPVARKTPLTSKAPYILPTAINLAGLRPTHVVEGASLDIAAAQPDGAVEHLIWLREWRDAFARPYFFRQPRLLPKGTSITIHSDKPAEVVLLLSR